MEYHYRPRQQQSIDALVAVAMSWYSQLPARTEGGHMDFRNGQRMRLVPELGGAEVTIVDTYRLPFLYQVRTSNGRGLLVGDTCLRPLAVEWKPGDVVVVTYGPGRGFAPYTYVRGAETWPVDKGRTPKTDEWMNRMYAQGKVTPKLQAGGEPFDSSRLPGGPPKVQPPAQGGVFHDDWLRG